MMMSEQKVDVLAVMWVAIACLALDERDVAELQMRVAVEAVAELIEAAQDVVDSTVNAGRYPDGPCIERTERDRLKAALDRIGGAE
jgi:hypothetical protein